MKRYLFALAAVVCGMFLMIGFTSCGEDNPILSLDDVEKVDLTSPLFLCFDNTLDSETKKIWAFNETEAVKGTITVKDDTLRLKSEWFYNTWDFSSKTLYLGKDESKRTYTLKKVSFLNYSAISFSSTYICIPSTNKSVEGKRYEEEWFGRGLTKNAFWDAFRQSSTEKTSVDIVLN